MSSSEQKDRAMYRPSGPDLHASLRRIVALAGPEIHWRRAIEIEPTPRLLEIESLAAAALDGFCDERMDEAGLDRLEAALEAA